MLIRKDVKKPMSIPIWIAIIWMLLLIVVMSVISIIKELCIKVRKVGLLNWYESWLNK